MMILAITGAICLGVFLGIAIALLISAYVDEKIQGGIFLFFVGPLSIVFAGYIIRTFIVNDIHNVALRVFYMSIMRAAF